MGELRQKVALYAIGASQPSSLGLSVVGYVNQQKPDGTCTPVGGIRSRQCDQHIVRLDQFVVV